VPGCPGTRVWLRVVVLTIPSLAGRIRSWLAATLLLAVVAARPAAAATLRADLDGDGSVDRVLAPGTEAGAKHAVFVELSGSPIDQRLTTDAPVTALVTADIDADGDLDLVAATPSGVRFWLNAGRGRLAATDRAPRVWSRLDFHSIALVRARIAAPRGSEAVFERDLGFVSVLAHELPAVSSTLVEAEAVPFAPSRPVDRPSSRAPPARPFLDLRFCSIG
jgi:hypothetical protein